MRDAAGVLLYRVGAQTTNNISCITQAEITRAAAILRREGVDVEQAVLRYAACGSGGTLRRVALIGVGAQGGVLWCTDLTRVKTEQGDAVDKLRWGVAANIEVAARQADAGLLALMGPDAATNFPPSSCSPETLAEVATFCIAEGLSKELVEHNVAGVERVRVWAVLAAGAPCEHALGVCQRCTRLCVCIVHL
jgi:phage tail protein X